MRNAALTITAVFIPALVAAEPVPPPSPSDRPAPTAIAGGHRFALAPRVGVVVSTAKLGPMAIAGLELDVATPALDHRLLVGLDGSITRPGHDATVMDPRIPGAASYSIHETEVVVAVLASYRLAGPDQPLVPWLGAGPMLHLLRTSESTAIAPGDNTEVSTELGVELAGGVDVRAGPGYLGADLRAAYSKLDHRLTGNTSGGKIALAASYRFTF